MKEVNARGFWTFESGTQEGIIVPIWVVEGFQQGDEKGSQSLNNDACYRPPVTSVQCMIGTENYPDSDILLNYNDSFYAQGYGQFKEAFRALRKDDILKPYISDQDFRSTNVNAVGEGTNDISYNLYGFDIQYQKKIEADQPIKVEFRFFEDVPAVIYDFALVLTNKLVSICSDGQRHFNLV